MSSIEWLIELVDGRWEEVEWSNVEVTGHLSEVLCHLVGINLTNESLHGSFLILFGVSIEHFKINFYNHVAVL